MKYSFIIPTFSRLPLLKRCLASIINLDYSDKEYEIIVVDDGSTDGTKEYLENFSIEHKNMKFVSRHNSGPAAARNSGLKIAKGKIIVSIDDDCTVSTNHLRELDMIFDSKKNVVAVSGAIINPTNSYLAWSHYILNLSSWAPFGSNRSVESFATGNAAFRRQDEIRFRESLKFSGYSDTLFSMELVKQGGKILFVPELIVKHNFWDYRPSISKFFDIQRRAGEGFLKGGFKFHGRLGGVLMRFRFLNLLLPRLLFVMIRSFRTGHFFRFLLCLPLIVLGELYRNIVIFLNRR